MRCPGRRSMLGAGGRLGGKAISVSWSLAAGCSRSTGSLALVVRIRNTQRYPRTIAPLAALAPPWHGTEAAPTNRPTDDARQHWLLACVRRVTDRSRSPA